MLSPPASHAAESHRTTLNVNFADPLSAMNPTFIAHRSLPENSRSIANKTRTGLWFAKIESGRMAHLHAFCKGGNSSKSAASGAFGWGSGHRCDHVDRKMASAAEVSVSWQRHEYDPKN